MTMKERMAWAMIERASAKDMEFLSEHLQRAGRDNPIAAFEMLAGAALDEMLTPTEGMVNALSCEVASRDGGDRDGCLSGLRAAIHAAKEGK